MTTYTEEGCPFKDGGCTYPEHHHESEPNTELRRQIEKLLYEKATSFQAINYEELTDDLLALFTTQNTALLKEVEKVIDWKFNDDQDHAVGGYATFSRLDFRSKLAAMGEQHA